MSDWKYAGYTKVKEGSGRSARYKETTIWACCKCGHEIRGYEKKPDIKCPKCEKEERK